MPTDVAKRLAVSSALVALLISLEGCGGGSSTPAPTPGPTTSPTKPSPVTPSPTTSPTTPGQTASPTPSPTSSPTTLSPTSPTPSPTIAPAPPGYCTDSTCCKKKSQNSDDGALCDAFYNPTYGIAATLLAKGTWTAPPCHGTGTVGMDKACFSATPPAQIDNTINQAFSLTNHEIPTCLYPGASKYGVVYSLAQGSGFYKWFTKPTKNNPASATNTLCGRCSDGVGFCASGFKEPLGDMTFDEFTANKNAIMDKTKDWRTCPGAAGAGQYNEFDSNGLSSLDLAGVISVESGGAAPRTDSPTDGQLCTFLKQVTPSRSSWPVYALDGFTCNERPSLEIQRYLNCGATRGDEISV